MSFFGKVLGFGGAIWRDFLGLIDFIRIRIHLKKNVIFRETVVKQFDKIASKLPNKTAILYYGQRTTFADLQALSNKIANWVESSLNLGLDDGKLPQIVVGTSSDALLQHHQIGLMLGNIPEMAAFFLGIARVRAVSVLFNTNHRQDSLLNAFKATNCKVFIFDSKYLEAIREIAHSLPEDIKFFAYNRNWRQELNNNNNKSRYDNSNYRTYDGLRKEDLIDPKQDHTVIDHTAFDNFAPILEEYESTPVQKKYGYEFSDTLIYIFTSGTTGGAIKATAFNNTRFIASFLSQFYIFRYRQSDNIYISLPLYHSFAGVLGLGRCILDGSTITLVDKFSASRFWNDCKVNGCTVALYIGEICRYLLAQPKTADETKHGLRMMHGLGLKREIWREFCTRFKIPKIAEIYGSSEGNINLFNTRSIEGSCGFLPYYFGPIARFLFPIYLIKVDPITLEPVRSKKSGLCKLAYPGDVGLIVGQILDNLPYTAFPGYTSQEETSKKILRNILKKGDYAFVSGDLMELDLYGYVYFKDRTGDTFRWKGENVSTTEIESIAGQFLSHQVCTVYGVAIPQTDGRAGMIAIKIDATSPKSGAIDLDSFYQYMRLRVPEYAVPKFVRFTSQIETTSTHKLIKYKLREGGFNPGAIDIGDRLFYFDKASSTYQQLTEEVYCLIQQGHIQF